MPYVYFHKNTNLFNKWLFIDNYFESFEHDIGSFCKTITIKNSLNVLEYKKNKVFIYFDAIAKLNSEFKFQYVNVTINNIEIYDETKSKNINIVELKNQLVSLYSNFRSFMNVIYFFNF
jgi:hypothetical protein